MCVYDNVTQNGRREYLNYFNGDLPPSLCLRRYLLEKISRHHLAFWGSFYCRLPSICRTRNHKPKLKIPFCKIRILTKKRNN